jgi:hypothetical protein
MAACFNHNYFLFSHKIFTLRTSSIATFIVHIHYLLSIFIYRKSHFLPFSTCFHLKSFSVSIF